MISTLYLLKLAAIGLVTIPAAIVATLFGLIDPHGKRVYLITKFWTWLILKLGGVRLRVHGLDRLDASRTYLFMVNHQSNLDIPVLVQSLGAFQLRWIAKKELLRVPFFGWAMWAGKHITVDRDDRSGAFASLKRAGKRMSAGVCVVVFPEGTRSLDGRLLPFKRGGFLLAAKARAAIVPVTIAGSGKILPRGDWRLKPGIVDVHIDKPLAAADARPGKLRELSAEVQRLMEQNLAAGPARREETASAGNA